MFLEEACLNIWCTVDERSGQAYRLAARGYAISGTDEHRLQVLQALAWADFVLAEELDVFAKLKTTVVDSLGRERAIRGVHVSHLDSILPAILEQACQFLEDRFPALLVADPQSPRTEKAAFGSEPLYVLTILLEDERGRRRPAVDTD